MHFSGKPMKFVDSHVHGLNSGAELFIVEGDSAAGAVASLCDPRTQAVLPMQGKPLNAIRATAERVASYPLFKELISALNVSITDIETGEISDITRARFERVLLLFDPDADGIHSGALMLMFFYRWMRPLLDAGRIAIVRPPLFLLTVPSSGDVIHAYSPEHAGKLIAELKRRGATDIKTHHHRGLASIESSVLSSACIHPATRKAEVMTVADAEQAISVFNAN
jgi:DNA gyrase subunit B